jgi:hypothetical protein
LIVYEKIGIAVVIVLSAALISLPPTSYMLRQQTASGFTTTIQSLSYNNPQQKIAIDYMPDWRISDISYGPQQYTPDRLFSVDLISPSENEGADFVSASINIDRLNPPAITLQEHEKKLVDTLAGEAPDVKDVVASSTTLSGNQAYRIDSLQDFAGELKKVIDVYTIKDGKLYELLFIGRPDLTDNKYSDVIQKMMESVRIG